MTRAASGPTPGIEVSSSTAARKGARCASTSRSTRAIAASSASTWSRCSRSRKRWWRRHPAAQRLPEPLRRRAEPRVGERGQPRGVVLARRQGLEHRPPALAEQVGEDPVELDVRVLERLLQPQHVARPLAHELLAGAQERAQLRRRAVRDEAGPDQAVRQQLGQPGRVAHVRLAARDVLDLGRVGQDQREPALGQDVPDRPPVDAGRLHRDVGAAVLRQPRGQLEQARGRGGEGADLAGDLAAGGEAHGGDHGRLVDVEAGAARVEDLHRSLLSARRRRGTPVGEV